MCSPAKISRKQIPKPTNAAALATGRQRGEGKAPSGKTNASASGHRNSTGHGAATVAAQRPRVVSPSSSATTLPSITTATASAPTSRIHATTLPGRRSETNSPTSAAGKMPASRAGAAAAFSAPPTTATTIVATATTNARHAIILDT